MPTSDPPPPSQPPASSPPASQPAPTSAPPSSGAINQAIAAVKALFPPDSSILLDLTYTSSDEDGIELNALLTDVTHVSSGDLDPITDAIAAQFTSAGISGVPYLTLSDSGGNDLGTDSEPPDSAPASTPPPSAPASGS